MKIELRFGPNDGEIINLPLGRLSDTIVTYDFINDLKYLYRKTERVTIEGNIIYQLVQEVLSNSY